MAKQTTKRRPGRGVSAKKTTAVTKKQTDKELLKFMGTEDVDGFEDVDGSCISKPFLKIAQTNSPQVLEDSESYIPGLKPGMFFSTASGKCFGKKLNVVVLAFIKNFVEWGENPGDFRGVYDKDEVEGTNKFVQEGLQWFNPETSNEVVDTRNFFLYLPDYPDEGIILLSLSKTGIKHANKWISYLRSVRKPGNINERAPIYSCVWELTTALNKNDKGSWYQIGEKETLIKRQGFVTPDLYDAILAGFNEATELKKIQKQLSYSDAQDNYSDADTLDGDGEEY